jgi:hypothetical protein
VDWRAGHDPLVYWGIGADHDVCWGPDWSLVEFTVSLYEWNGRKFSQLGSHHACKVVYWILQVDFVFNPIGSYNVDVAHSRSAEATAASASVFMT